MHKNSNEAVGNYGVYQINVYEKIYKIGKAYLDRITISTNTPTRIHQQVRKLIKKHGENNVVYDILYKLFGVKTKAAKELERKLLQLVYQNEGIIPKGNKKSFKPNN